MPKHNAASATHRVMACDKHAQREACESDAAVAPPQPSTIGDVVAETNASATRHAPAVTQSTWQSASMLHNTVNLLAKMSLTIVPSIVAKNTTTETHEEKLLALPFSLSSPRLCAHTNKKQSQGAAREDRTAGDRAVQVHFDALLTIWKTR